MAGIVGSLYHGAGDRTWPIDISGIPWEAGDVIFVHVSCKDNGSMELRGSPLVFEEIFFSSTTSGQDRATWIGHRTLQDGDDEALTWRFSLTGETAGCAVIYRGIRQAHPEDVFAFDTNNNLSNSATPPITTTVEDTIVFSTYWHSADSGSAPVAPAGYVLRESGFGPDGQFAGIASKRLRLPALETPGNWAFTAQTGRAEYLFTVAFPVEVTPLAAKTVVHPG